MLFSTLLVLLPGAATLASAAPATASTPSAPASTASSSKSKGCSKPLDAKFTTDKTAALTLPNSGGRTFRLHLPSNYKNDRPHPVYFSYHGATRDDEQQEGLTLMSTGLFDAHGIVVYPQGKNDRWLSNPSADTSRPNDLDFTAQLLDFVEDNLCVESTQVYAAGKSNGGGFTNVLACNATVGARFAAFAAVSGAYYDTDNTPGIGPCAPADRPKGTPFQEFHGTLDCIAPVEGEPTARCGSDVPENPKLPTAGIIEGWVKRNGCKSGEAPKSNGTVADTDNLVSLASWDCNGREAIVQQYIGQKIGHCWPSKTPNDDVKVHGDECPLQKYPFEGTSAILKFFQKHTL